MFEGDKEQFFDDIFESDWEDRHRGGLQENSRDYLNIEFEEKVKKLKGTRDSLFEDEPESEEEFFPKEKEDNQAE